MFVDVAKIVVKAGNGGNGHVSFLRDKYTSTGGPDGGNGGNGGSIIFVADNNLSTLSSFRYKKKFFAKNGANGLPGKKTGKKGEDLTIKVPYGTLIKDAETDELIYDLSSPEPYVLAKGGRGGAGNMNFANSVRQSPKFAKPGQETEVLNIKLELKLLADVGLVGYPNVGKSTIISVCSEAKPQIANYHFTTLSPILGVVKYKDGKSFVMADIPGLIEGAWKGVGLGHEFLRHIERCRLLVHVVDVSGSEGRDPCKDFDNINEELEKFNPELAKRSMIVVGNKCDIASEEDILRFKNYVSSKGYEYFSVVAASNQGIAEMLDTIAEKLSKLPDIYTFASEKTLGSNLEEDTFEIKKEKGVYVVKSSKLEKVIKSTNFDDYESLNYFQNAITTSGLTDALKNAGIKPGDSVSVNGVEFEFFE
mgnify:FL=1